MTKRKLKKSVIPLIYAIAVIALIGSIYLIEKAISPSSFKDDDYKHVTDNIVDDEIPVVGTDKIIIRPYTDKDVKIVKEFYDYKGEAEKQENALIYHENTYLQNSGVAYSGKNNFDVVSILDGTVIDVKNDNLLGNIVQISHSNDMISIYQSLDEVKVKKNDTVKQGQIIGKSGLSNISKELNSHLHFELIIKGQIVNPEQYYDKKVNEL